MARGPYSHLLSDGDYLARWKARCVVNEQGCWLWQGALFRNGYPSGCYRAEAGRIHRFAYWCHRGAPAPNGWDVCHTCDIRNCINPLHLFAAPRAINVQDMRAKKRGNNQKKTHCPHGHEYSYGNTYVTTRGHRMCKECGRIRMKNDLKSGVALDRQRRSRAKRKARLLLQGKRESKND